MYAIANVYHEFKGDSAVSVGAVEYKAEEKGTWLGLGLGGTHNWANDKFSVYGEIGVKTSTKHFSDEYELSGTVGFRIGF